MNPTLSAEQRFGALDAIARYATALDRRDWDIFRSTFTDDCDIEYDGLGEWHGLDDFTEYMVEIHARCGKSLHRLSNEVLELDGDRVRARTYVDALVLNPDNQAGYRSNGYYDDEIVPVGDGWKIARRRFTMVLATTQAGMTGIA